MKQTNLEWLLTLGKGAMARATQKFNELSQQSKGMEEDYCEYLRWLAAPRIEPIEFIGDERNAANAAAHVSRRSIRKEYEK